MEETVCKLNLETVWSWLVVRLLVFYPQQVVELDWTMNRGECFCIKIQSYFDCLVKMHWYPRSEILMLKLKCYMAVESIIRRRAVKQWMT